MPSWSRWLSMGAALGAIAALVPVVRGSVQLEDPLGKLESRLTERPDPTPSFEGIDLLRLKMKPRRVLTPLPGGRMAELTLDPVVQRAALATMKRYKVPEAGLVAIDVKTGKVVAYASHVQDGESFDVNVRAEAPAASTFKIVTGAGLVEKAGLKHSQEQCYRGGRSRITPNELQEDQARDKWCATLAMAMGRSINVIFARLAQKHLTPEDLTEMGGALGFGAPVPFVVKNEAPRIEIPSDPLEFARSAAGFWHTSLSPLAGAVLVQTVANGGVALKPRIVSRVYKGEEMLWEAEDKPIVLRRALKADTAEQLTKMMIQTVASGSAYKTFHDKKGRPFLPGMQIGGKTGTLTRHKENRLYTWLVAFAPAHDPEIAVAALVVNTPLWHIKGPHLAREVLRAYFAKKGVKGATPP